MTTFTGTGIKLFQLTALRAACQLQLRTGIKPNRHTNPLKIAQERYSCKRKDVLTHINAEILEVEALIKPGEITQ